MPSLTGPVLKRFSGITRVPSSGSETFSKRIVRFWTVSDEDSDDFALSASSLSASSSSDSSSDSNDASVEYSSEVSSGPIDDWLAKGTEKPT